MRVDTSIAVRNIEALSAYSSVFEAEAKIERDLRSLTESDPINQLKKCLGSAHNAYEQMMEMTRQYDEIKNFMRLTEPARGLESYDVLNCVTERNSVAEIMASEQRVNFANLYGLQKASESMRALQAPNLVETLISEAKNQKLQHLHEMTGASSHSGFAAEIAQILDARKAVTKEFESLSGVSAAKHALEKIRLNTFQQFNEIAGEGLQARVVVEMNLMQKRYDPFTDLVRDWNKSYDYSNLMSQHNPWHAHMPYAFDRTNSRSYNYTRPAPAPNTKKAPAIRSRPYLANRRMYDVTANVSGVLEAALREAINSELEGHLGADWIEASGLIDADKINSMKELQAKDAKDGDILSLYEYLTLGEVCQLAKRRNLWKPVMSKLFVVKRQRVIEIIDQLFKPRNVSTHRRSCLTQTRVEQTLINARFVANALQDDELLQAINDYELEFQLVTESQTIH